MIIKRPSIFIYTNEPDRDFLREVCAGIEEEGVFYEIIPGEAADLDELAYDAANDSMLGSGVGNSGTDIAMQMRGIAKGRNVEVYHMPTYEQCRRLGANSARAIKKQSFK